MKTFQVIFTTNPLGGVEHVEVSADIMTTDGNTVFMYDADTNLIFTASLTNVILVKEVKD